MTLRESTNLPITHRFPSRTLNNPKVFFLVATEEQLHAAKMVGAHLEDSFAIDPYAGQASSLSDIEEVTRPIKARVTLAAITRARLSMRRAVALAPISKRLLVIGQDVGLIERAAIAAALSHEFQLVLMPDGIVSSQHTGEEVSSGLGKVVREGIDRMLRTCHLVVGRRGRFGSSEPSLVLSWGAGWGPTWAARCPNAEIWPIGSPRADEYADMPDRPENGNLLICSQPLLLPQHRSVRREANEWYEWLIRLHRVEHTRIRIRLHPSEQSYRYPLPADLQPILNAQPTPLRDDLGWADVVVSPFSSVLVEALAAGRIPITAGATRVWGAFADNDFLADPRIPVIDFRGLQNPQACLEQAEGALAVEETLRDKFLANLGSAALTAARVLNP
jgi:hypothetical protein